MSNSLSVLTFTEVAGLIGVSVSTLYRWISAGTFPSPIRLGPARVGFLASTIDAWLSERPVAA
jgi:prophage regulatory protein